MPRGDGTGPQGKGSKTGRGMGRCGGKAAPKPTGQAGKVKTLRPGQGRKTGAGRNKSSK